MSRRCILFSVACVLLALVTLLVYLPVRHYAFVDFDDDQYVTQNPVVQAGLTWAGIKWAFTTMHAANWHPLTWLSLMLDCQLFGLNAGGFHLVNVLFHMANAVLLFVLLLRLTDAFWPSAFIAALFAWHPLHVESVAWIAERKDVLSAFFGLLALLAYVGYARKQSRVEGRESRTDVATEGPNPQRAIRDYFLALFFFACGLMAKPMLVTLPFVFLLLDYWPLQRAPGFELRLSTWWRLAWEKWPFLVLTAASCVVTFIAQKHDQTIASLQAYPVSSRIANVAVAYVEYLFKSVYPVNLAVMYPLHKEIAGGKIAGAIVVLVVISGLVWRTRRSCPYLLVGWLWYLGMLVPVIGLVQVGLQAFADRYTYLPLIGIFLGASFGIGHLATRLQLKSITLALAAILVLGGCLYLTAWQLRFWRNSETLFERDLAIAKDNATAQNDLGIALNEAGHPQAAIVHFQKALQLKPGPVNSARAHENLGIALAKTGHPREAIEHFRKASQLEPGSALIHYNWGYALLKTGQLPAAIEHFREALRLKPDLLEARNNLCDALGHFGYVLLQKGQINRAVICLQESLRIRPDNIGARNGLGFIFLKRGQARNAVTEFQKVLARQPDNVVAQNNLARILATAPDASLRNGAQALQLAQQANRLSGGKEATILSTLAAAYAETGRFPDAVATAQKALRLATAQTNTAEVNALRTQIKLYQAGSPFRDRSLTNIQAASP